MSIQKFVEVIKACEETNQRQPKMDALATLDFWGQTLVQEALNPYRVFGIRKWPKIKKYSLEDVEALFFLDLLNKLHERILTGNAARDEVMRVLAMYTEESARYLVRVIDKNLKCGITETTVNKVFPDLVPTFNVMLAQKVDAKYKFFFPCQAEYKMDGQRLIAICNKGVVTYFSRSGKPADFCIGLFDSELGDFEHRAGMPVVFDGEVLGDNFIETINAKSSDNDDAKKRLKFYVFDVMSLGEWNTKKCDQPQWKRSKYLDDALMEGDFKKLVKSKQQICQSMEELRTFYQQALDDGFEGLIIKDMDAPYEFDRSKYWAKWKPIIDVDLMITGIYEGKTDTKNEGRLGGFNVAGRDENDNYIESNVGSLKLGVKGCPLDLFIKQLVIEKNLPTVGLVKEWVTFEENGETFNVLDELGERKFVIVERTLSNDEIFRSYVFEHQEEFLGLTLQIEAQELSLADGREGVYSLRFPVAVMIRDDK